MANVITSPLAGPFIESRVSITSFRIATAVAFSIAMLIVAFRIYTMVQQRKRPGLDGIFLIFSTVFLIAGTTTLFVWLDTLYLFEFVILNGVGSLNTEGLEEVIDKLVFFEQMDWANFTLTWCSIYFVKFSFLSFFSGLCDRLPRMELYRRVVYGFCGVAFIFSVLSDFVECPKLGIEEFQCSTPESITRLLDYANVTITLDCVTDVMIILIPIILLWKVKLRIHQKIIIGVFLCLSTVMVIVGIIKVAGVKYYDSAELTWGALFQQVEACAAVSMISLANFRAVFISNGSVSSRDKQWKASIPSFLKRLRKSSGSSLDLNDVSIPRATMTGMRTVIGSVEEEDLAFPEQSATNMYHSGLSEKSFA